MQDYNDTCITTYIIGRHTDSFIGKNEFELHTIESEKSRWEIVREIVQHSIETIDDAVTICFDGHRFTGNYSSEQFVKDIIYSHSMGTHLLIGGCDGFFNAMPISRRLFWVDHIENTNFFVVFRSAYERIVQSVQEEQESLESILSRSLSNKLLLVPQISTCDGSSKADEQITTYIKIINKYNLL